MKRDDSFGFGLGEPPQIADGDWHEAMEMICPCRRTAVKLVPEIRRENIPLYREYYQLHTTIINDEANDHDLKLWLVGNFGSGGDCATVQKRSFGRTT